MSRPTILIEIEGGLVTSITASSEVNAVIIDRDTEGADEREITELDGECIWHEAEVAVDREAVQKTLTKFYEEEKHGI